MRFVSGTGGFDNAFFGQLISRDGWPAPLPIEKRPNLWAAPGSPVAPNCDLKRVGEPKSDGRSRFMRACDLPIHQPKIKSPSLCSAKKKLYKQKDKGYKDGKEMYWASADPVVKGTFCLALFHPLGLYSE